MICHNIWWMKKVKVKVDEESLILLLRIFSLYSAGLDFSPLEEENEYMLTGLHIQYPPSSSFHEIFFSCPHKKHSIIKIPNTISIMYVLNLFLSKFTKQEKTTVKY